MPATDTNVQALTNVWAFAPDERSIRQRRWLASSTVGVGLALASSPLPAGRAARTDPAITLKIG
jgi:hypothetical protein